MALIRPRLLGVVAGVLVVAAVAGNAIAMFNHPRLLDLLDSEMVQRLQIGTVLRPESEQSLAGNSLSRLEGLQLPKNDNQPEVKWPMPGDSRARQFLPGLLAVVAADLQLFLLFSKRLALAQADRHGRRLAERGHLVGVAALWPAVLCRVRLVRRRSNGAQSGDLEAARESLARSVAVFPDFADLQRTWLLAGKIDYRRGRTSPEQHFYRVTQLAVHGDRGQAIGLLKDLLDQYPCGRTTDGPGLSLGCVNWRRVYCDAGANRCR